MSSELSRSALIRLKISRLLERLVTLKSAGSVATGVRLSSAVDDDVADADCAEATSTD